MSTIIYVQDNTTVGTYTNIELEQLVWSLRYQGLYQYNRSPWVEHGYATAVEDVKLLARGATAPAGTWLIELLDTCDVEGALGYHEDKAFDATSPGPKKSSTRSSRGFAVHPLTGEPIPLAKIGVKTSEADGVQPSEVASHEMIEMLVDPDVVDESKIRKYLNPATKQWYIGEACDAAQGRGYDIGAPEGRPCGTIVADFCYPRWWDQAQTRPETTFAEEAKLSPALAPFVLAPGGYMSVAPEAEPTNWSQVYGFVPS